MRCRSTVRALAAAALLVVAACSAERAVDDANVVHVWKSPRHAGNPFASYDAESERIEFRVELPKAFTRGANVQVEVTNDGSDPVFVRSLDGSRIMLFSEVERADGFSPSGGNRAYRHDQVELVRLDPGQSILGSIRIDELLPITGTIPPSALDWEGENESIEGAYRLSGLFHSRGHAATQEPPDCDKRQLAGPSFVVPPTEWKR